MTTEPKVIPTNEIVFLSLWRAAISMTERPHLFGCGGSGGLNGYAPKIKEINRILTSIPKSKAALIAAMVSFFNPEEGAKMMAKVGVTGLGNLSLALNQDLRARLVLSDLFYNYKGW